MPPLPTTHPQPSQSPIRSLPPLHPNPTHHGGILLLDERGRPYQSIHIDDRKGRRLLAVFIYQDDTFQIVDERGDNRKVVIDTHQPKNNPQSKLAFDASAEPESDPDDGLEREGLADTGGIQ